MGRGVWGVWGRGWGVVGAETCVYCDGVEVGDGVLVDVIAVNLDRQMVRMQLGVRKVTIAWKELRLDDVKYVFVSLIVMSSS
jgi:hypothetical protein